MASISEKYLVPVGLVGLAADPAGGDSAAGDVYFNTTSGKVRYYDGSAWVNSEGAAAHTQNTDTGTTSSTFHLDSDDSGPKLKNNAGTFEVRNSGDTDYAPAVVDDLTIKGDLVVEGTQFIVDSNTVSIGDSNLELNGDNNQLATNSNGGMTVKMLKADVAGTGTISATGTAVTGTGTAFTTEAAVGDILVFGAQRRKITAIASNTALTIASAFSPEPSGDTFSFANQDNRALYYDTSTDRWKAEIGAEGSKLTKTSVLTHTESLPDAVSTTVTHGLNNLNPQMACKRVSDGVFVKPRMSVVDANSVKYEFSALPGAGNYQAIVTG